MSNPNKPGPDPKRRPSAQSGAATLVEGSVAPVPPASSTAATMLLEDAAQITLPPDSSGEYEGGGATLFGMDGHLGITGEQAKAIDPNAAPEDLIGQTIGGYKVEKKLGEGGMGSV